MNFVLVQFMRLFGPVGNPIGFVIIIVSIFALRLDFFVVFLPENPPFFVTDHINMTGVSPLFGAHGNERFVNMVDAYNPKLSDAMRSAAKAIDINLHEGVYAWFSGPQFETPAEIRAVKTLGANAVGMSTVPEVILARHQGIPLCALSVITNYAAGMSETDITHEQTIAFASKAADTVEKLLNTYLESQ